MKATENFFSKKRPWSLLKDEILRCYLVPYVSKVIRTSNRVIIASVINETLKQNPGADIEGVFIEKKYFKNVIET